MTSANPDARALSRPHSLRSRLAEHHRWRAAGYAAALLAIGAVALAVGLWGAEPPPRAPGEVSAGPGAVTRWGLPISRLVVDVSVVATIGMLVTAVLLPRRDGALGETALRCLRDAGRLTAVWAVSTLALVALLWSESSRLPVTELTFRELLNGPTALPDATRYLFVAVLAVAITAATYVTRTVPGVAIVLLLAAYNVLPLTTLDREGQSPLVAIAVSVHVIAISLWAGGLLGMLVHVRRSPELLTAFVPRFGLVALGCLAACGISGLVAGWLNLASLEELRGSHYGVLLIYKAEALVALGFLGWWWRRRAVADVAAGRSRRPFLRLAAIESALLVAAISLGVALSSTPAPAVTVPATQAPEVSY